MVHEPRLDDAFGAHHSKAFLAEYKGGLRVIVHTANLIHQVRWQALLRSASPASSMQCPAACLVALSFKVQTCMHISGCDSLPACLPLCALVGKPLPCFAHAGPEPEDTGALDAGLPKARPPPACPSTPWHQAVAGSTLATRFHVCRKDEASPMDDASREFEHELRAYLDALGLPPDQARHPRRVLSGFSADPERKCCIKHLS